jgi:hypothetical protein
MDMAAAFAKAALPKWLQPGSPTPFEMGLRGISSAMDALSSKSLPKFQTGLDVNQSVTSVSDSSASAPAGGKAGSNITINIENPKKETSEESVRKSLKSLSYLGILE